MRHTRTLRLAVTATVGLAALTACSGATTKAATGAAKSAVVSVAEAMSLTTKQTAGYTSMKMKFTEMLPKVGTITGSGAMSRNPLALDMTMSSPQFTQQLGADSVHMMMSGTIMYMNLGAKGAQQLGGKHWMKLDFASLGAGGKSLTDLLNKSNGQDPTDSVKLLTSSGDIRKVGTETVDGVQATHYSGTVDMKKLAAQGLGGQTSSSFKSLVDEASKLGTTTEIVDMWIDSRNLPVRVHEAAATNQGPIDATIDYSDFSNTPVTLTPPPAADTVDFAAMLKQAKSG